MLYQYSFYGLEVSSEIPLNEVIEQKSFTLQSQVQIEVGTVPDKLASPSHNVEDMSFAHNEMMFQIKDVGKFYVSNGTKIIVEPTNNCDFDDLKIFILGSSFGALLLQRNQIAIHGGAIVLPTGSIIITGDSGAGKSTLTAGFTREGYKFLSDDVCALNTSADSILVNPSYPQQKLCHDAMNEFDLNTKKYTQIDKERDKYALPCTKNFYESTAPLIGIFEINVSDTEDLSIRQLSGTEKLKVLMKNIYRIEFTNLMGLNQTLMKQCLMICNKVPVYSISRPKGQFTVKEQICLILRQIEQQNNKGDVEIYEKAN